MNPLLEGIRFHHYERGKLFSGLWTWIFVDANNKRTYRITAHKGKLHAQEYPERTHQAFYDASDLLPELLAMLPEEERAIAIAEAMCQ